MKQNGSKSRAQANPLPSTTLLDFFAAKPAGAPSAHPRKRVHGQQQAKTRATPQEIIVIDSDSDSDAVQIVDVGIKRRRTTISPARPAPPKRDRAVKLERPCDNEIGEIRPILNDAQLELKRCDFGIPVLLQDGSVGSGSSLKCDAPKLSPILDYRAEPTKGSEGAWRTDGQSESVVDLDLTLDEWATGDDELEKEPDTHQEEKIGEEIWQEQETFVDTPGDEPGDLNPKIEQEMAGAIPPERQNGQNHDAEGNAFSVLMSSCKENEAWKEASAAEDSSFRSTKANGGRRKAPFYKVLQGMPIAVDAFKYGKIPEVAAYFLTHAHSDHYTNLSSSWKHGPIYCSEGTANLIMHMLSVDKKWVYPLPMDTPTEIPNTNGVKVTLIEANHCPGSCLFFFEGRQTVNAGDSAFKSAYIGSERTFRYLHCGDFRASPQHVLHPAVKGKYIDHVYLDTTYLDPKYTFPPQALVISACANLAKRLAVDAPIHESSNAISSWFTSSSKGKGKAADKPTLFVVGTYSIGKERIVKAVARALGTKIFCDKRKADILRCQADTELHSMLTANPSDSVVHLLPLGMITGDKLKPYLARFSDRYSKIVGFRPTGWTYVQPSGTDQQPSVHAILTRTVQKTFNCEDLKPNGKSNSTVQMYSVPYSEHSSFYELTCFAMSLNWAKMIATVNVGSDRSRAKMSKWFDKWEAERKRRGTVEVVNHRHIEYW